MRPVLNYILSTSLYPGQDYSMLGDEVIQDVFEKYFLLTDAVLIFFFFFFNCHKSQSREVYCQNKCLDHKAKWKKKETEYPETANCTTSRCVRKVEQLKTQLSLLETC